MRLLFLPNVPPDQGVVFLLLLAMSAVMAFQAYRQRQLSDALIPCAAVLGYLATMTPALWGLPLMIVAGAVAWRGIGAAALSRSTSATLPNWVCLIPLGLTALALLYRLGSFAPEPLTWEATTIAGLSEEINSGRSTLALAASKALWTHAPISAGDNSLLFGVPALLLLTLCSPSVALLRAISLAYFVLAGAILARFAGRTFGGIVGLAAVTILCLCEPSLLYARYASSVAGTLCALTAAFVLCYQLKATPRYSLALLAPGALFLATVGYSPARIPVALLALFTPVAVLAASGTSRQKRWVTAALFSAVLVGVLAFQGSHDRLRVFFSGRGEQLFGMTQTGWFPPAISGLRSLSNGPASQLTPGEKVGVAIELVRQVTAGQLSSVVSPFPQAKATADGPIRIQADPPFWPVLPRVLAPFALIGFLALMRRKDPWLRAVLVAWPLATCAALLLTNRIDTHRAYFLIVPLALSAAVGLDALFQALRRYVPTAIVAGATAVAVLWFAVLPRADFLYPSYPDTAAVSDDFIALSEKLPGSVLFVAELPTKQSSLVRLRLISQHAESGNNRRWAPDYIATLLGRSFVSSRKTELEDIQGFLANGGTVVLSPPANFLKLASLLVKDGAEARLAHAGHREFYLISKRPSVAIQQLAPLAQIPDQPIAVPVQFPASPTVPLSSRRPLRVEAPIAKPKLNMSLDKNPLRIAGTEFRSGVALQAPTTVDLAVPPGTIGLQAMVGIDEESLNCGQASASVAFFDERQRTLFESPVMRAGEPPLEVSFALRQSKQLTIEVSDAGDGEACDHVDLGNAVWVLDPKAPQAPSETPSCICPAGS